MFRAQQHDAEFWHYYMGVDKHYYALAGIYDAVRDNTRATGNWQKKPPKLDPWPIPEVAVELARKAKDAKINPVANLFARFGGGGKKK